MITTALEFLRNNNEVAFATCADAHPHIRAFQIMKQEGTTLYFATSARKAVYTELQANPNVEMLAMAGKVSVRCFGQAHFNVDEDTKKWIYDNNEVLQRLYEKYDQMEYFCIPLDALDYYDLRPTPPILKHIDLNDGVEHEGFVGERFINRGKE